MPFNDRSEAMVTILPPSVSHPQCAFPHHVERAIQVDVYLLTPDFCGQRFQWRRRDDAGSVNQIVNAPKRPRSFGNRGTYLCLIAHIARNSKRALPDLVNDFLTLMASPPRELLPSPPN